MMCSPGRPVLVTEAEKQQDALETMWRQRIQHDGNGKRGGGGSKSPWGGIMPRHGVLFTRDWCRHLFAQQPPLLQADVTGPTGQNALAELLNSNELNTAGDLKMSAVWAEGSKTSAVTWIIYMVFFNPR